MKINDIATVTQRVETGAWVRDLPNLQGVAVKVRGRFNTDAARIFAEENAKFSSEDQQKPEIQTQIETKILLDAVLIDWSGIEDAPFSRATAEKLLTQPEFAIFRRAVLFASNVVDREGRDTLEATTKN